MDEENTDVTDPPSAEVNTYHCICSTLILASTHSLTSLPSRAPPAQDQAIILPLPPHTEVDSEGHHQIPVETSGYSVLFNTTEDRKAIVVRREDGFEIRTLVRCSRCNLVIGYKLDESQFTDSDVKADEVMYVLPGGLASTRDMKEGTVPSIPDWATEAS
jgi:hypothetical protein